ncbi:MAG: sugar ABC transporter substrate-binding protein [Candidatus Omnitrophota bacterium]
MKKRRPSRIFRGIFIIFIIAVAAGCFAPEKPDKKEIVIWHWMIDREDAFDRLAERYKQEKGIEVNFKLFFPPDIYSQKVIAAARAQNLPDIFGILGEKKTVASFITAGYIVDLTPYMEAGNNAWENRFYPKTLELAVFKEKNNYAVTPGIYAVPIDTTVMEFIYNKSLLEKAGMDRDKSPATFDELISYAKKASEKAGVYGFVCGWAEGWLLNALAVEWAVNLMGEEKFFQTIAGNILYTDKQWVKVFSLFLRLRDSGILAPGIATMTNKEAEDAFSKEKAVFSFNGSWSVNVYKQLAPDLDYAFFPLPKVSDRFDVKIWGGAGSSFMVSSNSRYKEEAVDFLRWLTDKKQQEFLIRETSNLPAVKDCEDSLPGILKSLLSTFSDLTHPDTWPWNEDSRVIEVMNRGLQQIVLGLKTPQKVAEEIQNTKERISHK